MGRHAAATAYDAPSDTSDVALVTPVTDPLLLPEVLVRSARSANRPDEHALRRTTTASPPSSDRAELATNAAVTQHRQQQNPRPVAPILLPLPRAAVARLAASAFTDGPIDIVPRLLAVPLTTVPISAQSAISSPRLPAGSAFVSTVKPRSPRRAATVAACALALLGAVSAAAIVLPTPAVATARDSKALASSTDATSKPTRTARAHGGSRARLAEHNRTHHRVRFVHWKFLGLDFTMPTPGVTSDSAAQSAPIAAASAPEASSPAVSEESSTPSASPSASATTTPTPRGSVLPHQSSLLRSLAPAEVRRGAARSRSA